MLTIGELCAGYGGLSLAVEEVFNARPAWFSEFEAAPSKILAYHWPDVPNHGDMMKIDWAAIEPVDIISGGTPCPDLSMAGKRAGMTEGTRSNLWVQMREAIAVIRPKYVVWENVRGAYSACADSEMGRCARCVDPDSNLPHDPRLRALGRVVGDLSDLGYDAGWHGVPASEIGAPHGRFRVFVLAWDSARLRWDEGAAPERGAAREISARGSGFAATESAGGGRPGQHDRASSATARSRWEWVAGGSAGSPSVPDPSGIGLERGGGTWLGGEGSANNRVSATYANVAGPQGPQPTQRRDVFDGGTTPNPPSDGRNEGRPEPARVVQGSDAAVRSNAATHTVGGGWDGRSRDQIRREIERATAARCSEITWGQYEPAIRRWGAVLGRPAPSPTETGTKGGQRLSPRFVEWMMGLSAGHVTDVPGISRNDQLKALGNGVVSAQAAAALRHLLAATEGVRNAA